MPTNLNSSNTSLFTTTNDEFTVKLPKNHTIQSLDKLDSTDLLLITTNNLPNEEGLDKGNGVELVYVEEGDNKNIKWQSKAAEKTANINCTGPLLSFITEIQKNIDVIDNDYKISYNDNNNYFQQSLNQNASIIIKPDKTPSQVNVETNSDYPSYQGSISNINILTIDSGDNQLNNCRKLNKYYYSLNKNINNKNLQLVQKESNDKEFVFKGGKGRRASLLISNNMNLYDENIHVLLNDNLYIKGLLNTGYLYNVGDILTIDNELFENYKFEIQKINDTEDNNRNFYHTKDFNNIQNKNNISRDISTYSSFNFTINLIIYSNEVSKDDENENNQFINSLGTDNNIIFQYKVKDSENIVIKNISINGIVNKDSFYVFRLIKFTDTNDNKYIILHLFNEDDKYNDLTIEIHKEFFYNNGATNSVAVNDNYDLNKCVHFNKSSDVNIS